MFSSLGHLSLHTSRNITRFSLPSLVRCLRPIQPTFQVQACEEAMIFLTDDFGIISDRWYHVYLGTAGNSVSYILVCVILHFNLKLKNYLTQQLEL